MFLLPADRLRLFRNFKSLETRDFHGIIRFYEQHEEALRGLDFEEYLDCTVAYTRALKQTGSHGRHIVMCDHLLELAIMHNIGRWGGVDLYLDTLAAKAHSLYCRLEYAAAAHVYREYLKLMPRERSARRMLFKCLSAQKPYWIVRNRAIAVSVFLFSAFMVPIEYLLRRYIPDTWLLSGWYAHSLVLAGGVLFLAFSETAHWLRCRLKLQRFLAQALQRQHKRF